jgi:hypothetical protein
MAASHTMLTAADIFFHIAQKLRCYSSADPKAAVDEFLRGSVFDIHLSITTDVAETELDYLTRYGKGHMFYFPLKDYFQGKDLISDIYFLLKGIRPNMCTHTGILFAPGEQAHLFIHLRNVLPTPVKIKLETRSTEISCVVRTTLLDNLSLSNS